GADELTVPRPIILGGGGGMYADPSAPALDEPAEGILLFGGQHIPVRVQEDDGGEGGQSLVGEAGGVFGSLDLEIIGSAQILDGLDAGGNGLMPIPFRFRENDYAEAWSAVRCVPMHRQRRTPSDK